MDQTICEINQIKRAAGYIRVSTAEQVQKKLSIETQIAEIESYAKLHNMRLEGIYIDRGITARKSLEKRLDFMRMMKDVQSGKINHIIVLRLDRFFRNVYDYHKMMNEYLEPNKCDWSAVKEQYTTTTTNGRLMINLRLAIAEQECDTDSDRIKDVLDHRARQGFAISGSQPYGYKIVDHRVVPDEETKGIVQETFNLMEELCSVRKVMNFINKKYGTNFTYHCIRRRLKTEMYYGKLRDIENYCEPIVTKEQFDKVQILISKNVRERKNTYVYIFSGLVVCNDCGRKMVGRIENPAKAAKPYFYYRCNSAVLDGTCDNLLMIRSETIEDYLYKNIRSKVKAHLLAVSQVNDEKPLQKSNRKAIEQKLLRLNALFVNGFIDMEKYKADFDDLQSQIVDIDPEPVKDQTHLQEFMESNFEETYYLLPPIEKQAFWRTIIKEIRVSGKDVVGIKIL